MHHVTPFMAVWPQQGAVLTAGLRPFRAGMNVRGRVPRALPWAGEFWRLWREGSRFGAKYCGVLAAGTVSTVVTFFSWR